MFAFWLVRTVVHWPVNIWQNKLEAVWILDILWHDLCSDKVSFLGGKQMSYTFQCTFQSNERRTFFQMWFDSVCVCVFLSMLQFPHTHTHSPPLHVSVALPCIPITLISIDTFLKVPELLPLESLSAILEYMFALPQQQKSKKMCHLMFSVKKKNAHVTWMLDDTLIGYYTLCSTSNILFLTKILNTASFCEYLHTV